jgi:peptide/nickel transport system permease protein
MKVEGSAPAYASFRAFVLERPEGVIAAFFLALIAVASMAAPFIAPQNPFDLASFDVLDANLPPRWLAGSDPRFLLGTDSQGRDLLSAILYGTRISLTVGILAVVIQAAIGIPLGLLAGYVGGRVDGLVSRIADVQLSLSTLILAIIALALVRAGLGGETLGSVSPNGPISPAPPAPRRWSKAPRITSAPRAPWVLATHRSSAGISCQTSCPR